MINEKEQRMERLEKEYRKEYRLIKQIQEHETMTNEKLKLIGQLTRGWKFIEKLEQELELAYEDRMELRRKALKKYNYA